MKRIFQVFASLKLTVALLTLGIILIFFGTLDQVHIGIREAQKAYFESFIAVWAFPREWPFGEVLGFLRIPMPGGYLIGPLLLVNLVAAHFARFKPTWRKFGISLIHLGIVMLLLSQLTTNLVQEEHYMWLDEGGSGNYLESFHGDELVVIEHTDPEVDKVVSIPVQKIRKPVSIQHPRLPFRVKSLAFFPNAAIARQASGEAVPVSQFGVNRGIGAQMQLAVQEVPQTFKQDERNVTTAVVEIETTEGSIGRWLVANVFDVDRFGAQTFTVDGRTFEIAMRVRREYLPYTLHLLDFTHDRYPGTQIPKNFSSLVRIDHPDAGEDRQTLIYMNHPLRYEGRTFYQASFANQDTSSMFQVVRNPGWLVPYISCILVTLGLIWQFGYHLLRFRRRSS